MKRVAIFVEGQTEAEFVRSLLLARAGAKGVSFIKERQVGRFFVQEYKSIAPNASHEILIADCCGDAALVSFIKDRYASLESAGYSYILGLRDLFPLPLSDLSKLQQGIASQLPTGTVPVDVTVAVAEVEAWFIEEITHFIKMDTRLTPAAMQVESGYDVTSRTAESLPHPAEVLHKSYQAAGLAWRKTARHVHRLTAVLDYAFMYNDSRNHSQSLDAFLNQIDHVLV